MYYFVSIPFPVFVERILYVEVVSRSFRKSVDTDGSGKRKCYLYWQTWTEKVKKRTQFHFQLFFKAAFSRILALSFKLLVFFLHSFVGIWYVYHYLKKYRASFLEWKNPFKVFPPNANTLSLTHYFCFGTDNLFYHMAYILSSWWYDGEE